MNRVTRNGLSRSAANRIAAAAEYCSLERNRIAQPFSTKTAAKEKSDFTLEMELKKYFSINVKRIEIIYVLSFHKFNSIIP